MGPSVSVDANGHSGRKQLFEVEVPATPIECKVTAKSIITVDEAEAALGPVDCHASPSSDYGFI